MTRPIRHKVLRMRWRRDPSRHHSARLLSRTRRLQRELKATR